VRARQHRRQLLAQGDDDRRQQRRGLLAAAEQLEPGLELAQIRVADKVKDREVIAALAALLEAAQQPFVPELAVALQRGGELGDGGRILGELRVQLGEQILALDADKPKALGPPLLADGRDAYSLDTGIAPQREGTRLHDCNRSTSLPENFVC